MHDRSGTPCITTSKHKYIILPEMPATLLLEIKLNYCIHNYCHTQYIVAQLNRYVDILTYITYMNKITYICYINKLHK